MVCLHMTNDLSLVAMRKYTSSWISSLKSIKRKTKTIESYNWAEELSLVTEYKWCSLTLPSLNLLVLWVEKGLHGEPTMAKSKTPSFPRSCCGSPGNSSLCNEPLQFSQMMPAFAPATCQIPDEPKAKESQVKSIKIFAFISWVYRIVR